MKECLKLAKELEEALDKADAREGILDEVKSLIENIEEEVEEDDSEEKDSEEKDSEDNKEEPDYEKMDSDELEKHAENELADKHGMEKPHLIITISNKKK